MTCHFESDDFPVLSYDFDQVVWFKKTKEQFGGLSNMASGYPLIINCIRVYHNEALYQALRYPDYPEIQKLILGQPSPMTAKMKSKKNYQFTRADWDEIKIDIMNWALNVKLLYHLERFGKILISTGTQPIVEYSHKDTFWGMKLDIETNKFFGQNILGCLLETLRNEFLEKSEVGPDRLYPPKIPNLLLIGTQLPVLISPFNH